MIMQLPREIETVQTVNLGNSGKDIIKKACVFDIKFDFQSLSCLQRNKSLS